MTMKIEENHVVLSTGRRLSAYRGVVGLRITADDELPAGAYGGFDNTLDTRELTDAEALELATFMAYHWARWALDRGRPNHG
jgi:hypothetical protein